MSYPTILFLGPQSLPQYEQFFKKFLEAASLSAFKNYQCLNMKADLELGKNWNTLLVPQLVFLDASPESGTPAFEDLYKISQSLKKLDPKLFILVISSNLDGGSKQIQGLDQGVDAYIHWDLNPKKKFEMLREAVENRLNATARPLRVPMRHHIRMTLASLEQAIVAETLNVGTGGMFVRTVPQNVQKNDPVDFELIMGGALSESFLENEKLNPLDRLENGNTQSLTGSGVVVWVRQNPERDMPEGIGIEFSQLHEKTKTLIEAYVRQHKIQSFIPMS